MFCFNNNVCLCELIVLREAPCRVHGKLCNLLCFGLALIHMAGTSCIAWSDMGINEGFAAESTGHFLIWAALSPADGADRDFGECPGISSMVTM